MRKAPNLSGILGSCLLLATSFAAARAQTHTTDELAALLPASDVMIATDAGRALRELLPRLKALGINDIDQIAADIENFSRIAGVDPQKLGPAVAGLRLKGLGLGGGAIVLSGLDLDAKRVEAAAAAANWQFHTIDAEGKNLYRIVRTRPAPDGAAASADPPAPPKTDEIFFALPGGGRLIAGDGESVRAALGAPSSEVNAALRAAIKEAPDAAIARFSAQLPAEIKAMLEDQGDLFKQLAAVQVIFGSLDIAASGDASIEARLRTASAAEAAEMETGLKSLVFFAKSLLGSTDDPKMQPVSQLIDQIKVVTAAGDVRLSVTIPKALLDEWAK
ncbi:MAG: hypothetical protein KIT57_18480 [Blastocatellales bacterium]|nr:hypothetical protein [Blastocatellales bacterium]